MSDDGVVPAKSQDGWEFPVSAGCYVMRATKLPKLLVELLLDFISKRVHLFTYPLNVRMTCKHTKVCFQKRGDSTARNHCCVPQCTASAP